MRENGIYSITRYKHRPYPKEKVETRYTDNIVKREFLVIKPDLVWCGDITYIRTQAGWVYHRNYKDLGQVSNSLFEYIELFYNRKRMHSSIAYSTPKEHTLQLVNMENINCQKTQRLSKKERA